jgi:hydroxyethylthiazole kinase
VRTDRPWECLRAVRERAPLVHCISNYVAMDVTANALLALGASPVMAHALEEVEELVSISRVLVVNIGTLSPEWVRAMEIAADRAVATGKPWVLDPVGAGATVYRTEVARSLARRGPAVIRGNASEVLALAGGDAATKGVDSTRSPEQARVVAEALARELGCVVAVTGAVDHVTNGHTTLAVSHGHPLMTRVTALGCAATAVVGAFAAVAEDPLVAAADALALFGLAGELAARATPGPGTFRVRFLDELYALDVEDHEAPLRIATLGGV